MFGGGERYLIDLASLIIKLGYHVDVFQPSNIGEWRNCYRGINIYGIEKGDFDRDFYIGVNKKFKEITQNYDYHIYFNLDVLYPYVFPNSICISHGIWWDSTEKSWWRSKRWFEYLSKGLANVTHLISVDTNTINWVNAVMPEVECIKSYIPNYVDLNVFNVKHTAHDEINILYPRRLCNARGWNITMELAFELTEQYDNFRFSFVGRGLNDNIEEFMNTVTSKNDRIKYAWHEPDEMNSTYESADIVLIPSLCSEGTSLSLLEAMACGKPVIAGLTGGLTDLVIHGFNGYLIDVNKENLKNAILTLADNADLRYKLGKNARSVAECFSKEIWEKHWEEVILNQFK